MTHTKAAATRGARAAAFACCTLLALASACADAAPAASSPATPDLDRPRAENARLARRVAELEIALADARRARGRPIDQPVIRSWIERAPSAGDSPAFDLCIQYFAHGDFLDLLPTALGLECRRFTVPPAAADPAAALRALVTHADFACWSRAAVDRPLPACWR